MKQNTVSRLILSAAMVLSVLATSATAAAADFWHHPGYDLRKVDTINLVRLDVKSKDRGPGKVNNSPDAAIVSFHNTEDIPGVVTSALMAAAADKKLMFNEALLPEGPLPAPTASEENAEKDKKGKIVPRQLDAVVTVTLLGYQKTVVPAHKETRTREIEVETKDEKMPLPAGFTGLSNGIAKGYASSHSTTESKTVSNTTGSSTTHTDRDTTSTTKVNPNGSVTTSTHSSGTTTTQSSSTTTSRTESRTKTSGHGASIGLGGALGDLAGMFGGHSSGTTTSQTRKVKIPVTQTVTVPEATYYTAYLQIRYDLYDHETHAHVFNNMDRRAIAGYTTTEGMLKRSTRNFVSKMMKSK